MIEKSVDNWEKVKTPFFLKYYQMINGRSKIETKK